jgi:hypothetical protein
MCTRFSNVRQIDKQAIYASEVFSIRNSYRPLAIVADSQAARATYARVPSSYRSVSYAEETISGRFSRERQNFAFRLALGWTRSHGGRVWPATG